jgi:hypothetical protein
VIRSSVAARSVRFTRPASFSSKRNPARPSSLPAGVPGKAWSVLSFRLSLKMHLARPALQALWPRLCGKYKWARPDSASTNVAWNRTWIEQGSPLLHSHPSR